MAKRPKPDAIDAKSRELESSRVADETDSVLTTNQGVPIADDHDSLKAGPRGPSLLEDFILREKITHFDHERIPERIVHARGAGAYGYFECTKAMTTVTRASFLSEVGKRTPALVRFSTVAGSRGSADCARDPRGFAVKLYTDQGNYDIVGNNIPVFFIQDAMKFPDLIHAVKPEPHNEIPQAASAHDTFWDFISLMPEALHMVLWQMSDRAIPRSFRMMEGFAVHTFKMVNAANEVTFVKLHWKPALGAHGLLWDEASSLNGKDPDFHRRDLFDSIAAGDFPTWELGLQLIPESMEGDFPFDLLDPTKLVPEEMVPVERVGRLVLDRNPDNFFAEIEQAAFHPGHIVDGIDFSDDPLLQGRLFSYTDTQLIRLGGPNFHQLPPNRPLATVRNHQRDGFGQQNVNVGKVAYDPNSLGGGCPMHAGREAGAFVSQAARVDAHKVRARSASFSDHTSQAKLFYRSQTEPEQEHIGDAFIFELSKVETVRVREKMLELIAHVDKALVSKVAYALGLPVPKPGPLPPSAADPKNNIVPANEGTDAAKSDDKPLVMNKKAQLPEKSPSLSMVSKVPHTASGRIVAILVTDGVDGAQVSKIQEALNKAGVRSHTVAPHLGSITSEGKPVFQADRTLVSTVSLFYDGVIVPGGATSATALCSDAKARSFISQSFKHAKTIGIVNEAEYVLTSCPIPQHPPDGKTTLQTNHGITISRDGATPAFMDRVLESLANHRHWDRPELSGIPA